MYLTKVLPKHWNYPAEFKIKTPNPTFFPYSINPIPPKRITVIQKKNARSRVVHVYSTTGLCALDSAKSRKANGVGRVHSRLPVRSKSIWILFRIEDTRYSRLIAATKAGCLVLPFPLPPSPISFFFPTLFFAYLCTFLCTTPNGAPGAEPLPPPPSQTSLIPLSCIVIIPGSWIHNNPASAH